MSSLLLLLSALGTGPRPRPRVVDVAIAGGGLGGLATCAALRSRGIDCMILERAKELRYESQGSIAIQPNGVAAIDAIDEALGRRLRKRSIPIRSTRVISVQKDGSTSERVVEFFKQPSETLRCPWAEVQNELSRFVSSQEGRDDWVMCQSAVESFTETEDGVVVHLADGREVNASVLVGADGVFSRVRAGIVSRPWRWLDVPVRYPQTNWNAIVPRETTFGTRAPPNACGRIFELASPKAQVYQLSLRGNRVFWQVRPPAHSALAPSAG